MKELDINDFSDDIKKENYDAVYNIIMEKSIEFAREIAKLKQVDIPEEENERLLYTIKFEFSREFVQFREVIDLMKNLIEWNYDGGVWEKTPLEKIELYIKEYNSLISEMNYYLQTEQEIKENGYERLVKEYKEKFINLFKEMLQYKNKKYNENDTLEDLINKVDMYYNYYSSDFQDLGTVMHFQSITLDYDEQPIDMNNTEVIMFLKDLYIFLTDEENGYKNYAYFYREFELKEGQTYEDLLKLEEEKFINLFKEMLDFLNVNYDKEENNVNLLKSLVSRNYPYYKSLLQCLRIYSLTETYIQILDMMETIYEKISSDYKNHEENMRKYKERKED